MYRRIAWDYAGFAQPAARSGQGGDQVERFEDPALCLDIRLRQVQNSQAQRAAGKFGAPRADDVVVAGLPCRLPVAVKRVDRADGLRAASFVDRPADDRLLQPQPFFPAGLALRHAFSLMGIIS